MQRFPKCVGNQSLVRELAFTGRKLPAEEALAHGVVSKVFPDKTAMLSEAMQMARVMASKSPVAALGIKTFLNYTRDHPVPQALDYAITWNMGALQGDDMPLAGASALTKETPVFANLPKVDSKL